VILERQFGRYFIMFQNRYLEVSIHLRIHFSKAVRVL
jgi:hypothetical protein